MKTDTRDFDWDVEVDYPLSVQAIVDPRAPSIDGKLHLAKLLQIADRAVNNRTDTPGTTRCRRKQLAPEGGMHRAPSCTDQDVIRLAGVDRLEFQRVGIGIGVVEVAPEGCFAASNQDPVNGPRSQLDAWRLFAIAERIEGVGDDGGIERVTHHLEGNLRHREHFRVVVVAMQNEPRPVAAVTQTPCQFLRNEADPRRTPCSSRSERTTRMRSIGQVANRSGGEAVGPSGGASFRSCGRNQRLSRPCEGVESTRSHGHVVFSEVVGR